MLSTHEKTAEGNSAVFQCRMPGSDLLSRNRTLHYHRRGCISLLCSEWLQVVLQRYGRQAYSFNLITSFKGGFNLTLMPSGVVWPRLSDN